MMRTPILTLVLAAALAAPLVAQSQPAPSPAPSPESPPGSTPSFPSKVEVVNVDVVVVDKKGNPVTDLTKEDFRLYDEGQAQTITSFEAVKAPSSSPPPVPAASPAPPPPPPKISTNVGASQRSARTFSIVFDDIHLTAAQAHRAKIAIAEFLKNGTRDGDIVTLAATGGGAWWNARMPQGREELITLLKRLDGRLIPDVGNDRVTDYEAMRIILFSDSQVAERVTRRFQTYGATMARDGGNADSGLGLSTDPIVRARAQEVYFRAVSRNRISLELMDRMLKSLASTRGRKAMVLVSQGFVYDPSLVEFKEVVQAARRSNVAVYFLDTRGLGGFPVELGAEFGPSLDEHDIGFALTENLEASGGAESVAIDSGGFVVSNNNDLLGGIERIAAESSNYYLLGFNPSDTRRDGKFRKLSVKVERKGVQVRARKGYYAPSDTKLAEKKTEASDPDIQKALDSPYDADTIPLRISAYVFDETLLGKAATLVATEADINGFAFEEKDGRFVDTLEFLLVVAHRETGEFFRYDQKVEMKLLPETREKARTVWFPIVRDFELPAGAYQAKMVVRDKQSGRIGTVLHEFEVPPLGQFRTSTPILSDTLLPTPEGVRATPKPQLLARRSFPQGAMLYCQYDVFGAAKDPATGMPKVSAGYTIRAKDGAAVTSVPPSVITPTSLGKLSRITGSSLKDAAPGDYELVLSLKDEIQGNSLELVEPFKVVAPAPAD
jgi:VWFA-related protein